MWTNYSLCSVKDQELLKVESLTPTPTRPARSDRCSLGSPTPLTFKDIILFTLENKKKAILREPLCDFMLTKRRTEHTYVRATEIWQP